MNNIVIILIVILINNIAYPQSINIDKAKEAAVSKGINDNKIISNVKEIRKDLNSKQINSDPTLNNLDIIEINNIKYVKDGLRYVPVIENLNETNQLSNSDLDNANPIIQQDLDIEEKVNELDYFGYDIFTGDPNTFQASTFGAVDPDYNIGPGDQIILMLWGESQFRQEFTVDREGYVFLPEVGQLFVNGLNLEDLENKFFQILSKVYSTLKPLNSEPTTFMDLSLGSLRPLRIIALGEIAQPGSYAVSPSATLSSSLYYFSGPKTSGSLREIRLIRNGKTMGTLDFYDYLLSGNSPNDLRLQLDDIIFIPNRGKTVTIIGEINREGIYELKGSEGLKKLIEVAGNLKSSAYLKRAQIRRIVPFDKRNDYEMDRIIIDLNLSDKKDILLYDEDIIEIFPIQETEGNYVEIIGTSIERPGKYQLYPGMRLLDIINKADGLLNNAYLDLAHIVRIDENMKSKIISLDLNLVLTNNQNHNILMKNRDVIHVYNSNYINNSFVNVFISGAVKNDGYFQLEKDKKLSDIIIHAGGFKQNIKKVKISVARLDENKFDPILYSFPSKSSNKEFFNIEDLKDKNNEINKFILAPNDIINIYSDPKNQEAKMVYIQGAISYPGNYPINKNNEKVSDIINRAGGLLKEAYPLASTFIRNGQFIQFSLEDILKNPKSNKNFKVMSNDTISILTKPNIVQVIGEVNNPGYFQYFEGSNINDYLDISGGLTTKAEKKEIWVTYPDGTSRQLKRFGISPKVYDGSLISVGIEEDSEPIDKTEFAKELASIISDFLQIAITLALLSREVVS